MGYSGPPGDRGEPGSKGDAGICYNEPSMKPPQIAGPQGPKGEKGNKVSLTKNLI